jgi:hypothetical protein
VTEQCFASSLSERGRATDGGAWRDSARSGGSDSLGVGRWGMTPTEPTRPQAARSWDGEGLRTKNKE